MLNSENYADEIWKDSIEFPDRFEVSSYGRVRNKKTKVLKVQAEGSSTTKGYKYISISVNNHSKKYSVHRMVAKAFIPNPDNKPQVNHINSIRQDNRICNLEWVTVSENIRHAMQYGSMDFKSNKGKKHSSARSKYHNICWRADKQRWTTTTKINGKRVSQRLFKTEIEAAQWADELLRLHNITDRPFNFP